MSATRRAFFGAAAGGVAAAKAAAAELAGLADEAPSAFAGDGPEQQASMAAFPSSAGFLERRTGLVSRILRDPMLMDLVRRNAAESCGVPSRLDPDLVVNRSMSLSTKLRLQRERNIQARVDEMMRLEVPPWMRLNEIGLHW